MALINCPECEKDISDRASKCPNCGYPIYKDRLSEKTAVAVDKSQEVMQITLSHLNTYVYLYIKCFALAICVLIYCGLLVSTNMIGFAIWLARITDPIFLIPVLVVGFAARRYCFRHRIIIGPFLTLAATCFFAVLIKEYILLEFGSFHRSAQIKNMGIGIDFYNSIFFTFVFIPFIKDKAGNPPPEMKSVTSTALLLLLLPSISEAVNFSPGTVQAVTNTVQSSTSIHLNSKLPQEREMNFTVQTRPYTGPRHRAPRATLPSQQPDYDTMQILGAAFRQENIIISGALKQLWRSLLIKITSLTVREEERVNWFEMIRGTPYQLEYPAFLEARTEVDVYDIMRRLDRERADREILEQALINRRLPY